MKDLAFDAVLTDKGYDSNLIAKTIKNQDAEPIIPPRKNRKIQSFMIKKSIKNVIK